MSLDGSQLIASVISPNGEPLVRIAAMLVAGRHSDAYRESRRAGGIARALLLSPARRTEIARQAAQARWNPQSSQKPQRNQP